MHSTDWASIESVCRSSRTTCAQSARTRRRASNKRGGSATRSCARACTGTRSRWARSRMNGGHVTTRSQRPLRSLASTGPAADAARREFSEIIDRKGHAVDNARAALIRLEQAFAAGDLTPTPEIDQTIADLQIALDQEEGQKL